MKYKLASLFLASSLMWPAVNSAKDSLVKVPNTPISRKILAKLGLDYSCMGGSKEHLHYLMNDEAREAFRKHQHSKMALFEAQEVVAEDVNSMFPELSNDSDLGIYHTYEEMETVLKSYESQYSDIFRLEVGAKSYEGRNIYVAHLGNPEAEKSFFFMGSHHSREWISVEVPLAIIKELLQKYERDEQTRNLIDTTNIVIIPMLNPDGAVYSREKYKMWRKNRKPTEDSRYVGVDNNRNYDYKWGLIGASSWPGSDTYMGPHAESEVENQLIVSLAQKHNFTGAISFHSYSELVIWPWGYTDKIQSKDHAIFAKYGKEMGKIMGYKPMQISGLYPAAGGFDDRLYADFGVLAYTFELGKWFVPKEHEVPEILENSIKAVRYFLVNARDPFAGVSNTPVYEAMRYLEKIVYDLEVKADEDARWDSVALLDKFEVKEIEQAMEELAMDSTLRSRILQALAKSRRYGGLYTAQ